MEFHFSRVRSGKTIACYKHVLFLPFKYQWIYGHWLNEALSMIISMPREILDLNPVIITSFNPIHAKFTLEVFNLSHLQIVDTGRDYVYGENVYMCKAFEDVHGFGLTTFPKIKSQFRQYFKLDQIEPTEYIFVNKQPGENRYFVNMNDVISLAISATNISWRLVDINISDRVHFARIFASSKVVVTPSGSFSFNMLYMADGTGIVTIAAKLIDYPGQRLAYFVNIWCITVIHHNLYHHVWEQKRTKKPYIANPTNVVSCIKVVLYAVKYQRWPQNHTLMESFNLSLIERKRKEIGDEYIVFDEIMEESIENYNNKLPQSIKIPIKK